jgi:hypothetical protein
LTVTRGVPEAIRTKPSISVTKLNPYQRLLEFLSNSTVLLIMVVNFKSRKTFGGPPRHNIENVKGRIAIGGATNCLDIVQ